MYYINVYDKAQTKIMAREIADHADVRSVLTGAYYELGLVKPDYDVFLSPEVAIAVACQRKRKG